jgi:hypothetical protein
VAVTVVTAPAVGPDGLTHVTLGGKIGCLAATAALAAQGWSGGCTVLYDGTNTTVTTGATPSQVEAAITAYVYNPQQGWTTEDQWLQTVIATAQGIVNGTVAASTVSQTTIVEVLARLILILASRLAPPAAS